MPLAPLEQASVDARGSTPYFGAADGRPARCSSRRSATTSAAPTCCSACTGGVSRRDLGDERPFSSLRRAVEHEALVALAARDLGDPHAPAASPSPPPSRTASCSPTRRSTAGRSTGVEPDEITDDVLAAVWAQVAELRRHRIAHRDLRLANIFLADDGEVWMIDFGFSELAASDLLLATDVAELVASSSAAGRARAGRRRGASGRGGRRARRTRPTGCSRGR